MRFSSDTNSSTHHSNALSSPQPSLPLNIVTSTGNTPKTPYNISTEEQQRQRENQQQLLGSNSKYAFPIGSSYEASATIQTPGRLSNNNSHNTSSQQKQHQQHHQQRDETVPSPLQATQEGPTSTNERPAGKAAATAQSLTFSDSAVPSPDSFSRSSLAVLPFFLLSLSASSDIRSSSSLVHMMCPR